MHIHIYIKNFYHLVRGNGRLDNSMTLETLGLKLKRTERHYYSYRWTVKCKHMATGLGATQKPEIRTAGQSAQWETERRSGMAHKHSDLDRKRFSCMTHIHLAFT